MGVLLSVGCEQVDIAFFRVGDDYFLGLEQEGITVFRVGAAWYYFMVGVGGYYFFIMVVESG